jgi:hypothetical protein
MIIYVEYGHKKIREERMRDVGFTIYDLGFGIWDLRYTIYDLEFGIWNLGFTKS